MILLTFILSFMPNPISYTTLSDFSNSANSDQWVIVNDSVMGGKSLGKFLLDQEGFGVFYGAVSLENNGGFSLLRSPLSRVSINDHKSVVLKVKGDGKRYQFRIKDKLSHYYSFVTYITPTTSCIILEGDNSLSSSSLVGKPSPPAW